VDAQGLQALVAPCLLLAMPQIQDPFFSRSVVLLLVHEHEGSFGFVVNRPSNLAVGDILSDLEISWRGRDTEMAFVGGPVQPQLGTVIFPTPIASSATEPGAGSGDGESSTSAPQGFAEVAPGIALTQSLEQLCAIAESPYPELRLLLGYAGWGQDQLATEISRHDWIIAPVAAHLVFNPDPDQAWQHALGTVGIEAASLPTWTAPGNSGAN
jgi:putative transcriptional regulator